MDLGRRNGQRQRFRSRLRAGDVFRDSCRDFPRLRGIWQQAHLLYLGDRLWRKANNDTQADKLAGCFDTSRTYTHQHELPGLDLRYEVLVACSMGKSVAA